MPTEITVSEEPEPEVVAEAVPVVTEAAAETIAEAAVTVAETEAARDIAVAEVHAETERQAIEAAQETATEGQDEWRSNLEARLATTEARQEETLSILQQLSERLPPPNPPENLENPEAMPDSQEAPEPPAKSKRAHHRLI